VRGGWRGGRAREKRREGGIGRKAGGLWEIGGELNVRVRGEETRRGRGSGCNEGGWGGRKRGGGVGGKGEESEARGLEKRELEGGISGGEGSQFGEAVPFHQGLRDASVLTYRSHGTVQLKFNCEKLTQMELGI